MTEATTSKRRCAKTVPTIVAHVPGRRRTCRVTTATRASSPTRPGRAAFPSRPMEKAEKTVRRLGQGRGIACLMTMFHASARTTTEKRLIRTAAATHSHSTARNARSTGPGSGPRHTASPTRATIGTSTTSRRPARLRGGPTRLMPPPGPPPPEPRAARRSRRAGHRSDPRSTAPPPSSQPRRARGAAPRPRGAR